MMFKKPACAGLVALFFGVLLALCLTVSSYTPTYAQDQAPAAENAGPTVETLPCDSKVYKPGC
jgi:hypothetical protein